MLDRIRPIVHWISEYWLWLCVGVLVFSIGMVQRIKHIGPKPTRADILKDVTMTIEGRRMFVHKVMLDAICDAALEKVLSGEITTQEMNDELGKLAKIYDKSALENLIRERRTPALKAELRHNKRRRQTRNEKPVPVPLPRPKKDPVDPDSLQAILGS